MKNPRLQFSLVFFLLFTVTDLQATDVNHDARISAIEENGGNDGESGLE